jgi:hypothetical protein
MEGRKDVLGTYIYIYIYIYIFTTFLCSLAGWHPAFFPYLSFKNKIYSSSEKTRLWSMALSLKDGLE